MNQDEMTFHAQDLAHHIVDSIKNHPGEDHRDNLAGTLVDVYKIGLKECESAASPPEAEPATEDQIARTKHILLSKTVWGAVIGAVAMFGPKVGLHIGTADQTKIVSDIVAVLGTVLTMYGRFTAKGPLRLGSGE